MTVEEAARLIAATATYRPAHRNVPPIMTRPELLAPDESWRMICPRIITGTDRTGRVRTLPCAITTQGGRAGLAAHLQVVHGC